MGNKTVSTYTGDDIDKELRKLYDRDSRFIYLHMLDAVRDENLKPFLVLEITRENRDFTSRLYDKRTGENIK